MTQILYFIYLHIIYFFQIFLKQYYISKLTGEETQNEKIKYNYTYSPLPTNENNSVKKFDELQSNNNNTTMAVLNNTVYVEIM